MTRLMSFSVDGRHSFGLVDAAGTGVIDVADLMDPAVGAWDLHDVIARGQLDAVRSFADRAADHQLAGVTFERPLHWPSKIFCIGVNYGGRAAEYAAGAVPGAANIAHTHLKDRLEELEPTLGQAVGNGLECDMEYKDGRRTKRQNPQWRLSAADCANILTKGDYSVHSGYKVGTGRFSIGQRKNWLYSKRLFGGEEQLRQTIAQLLTRARDSDGQ